MTTDTSLVQLSAPAAYEGLGWFYDRYWRRLSVKIMPALDRLVLGSLPRRARVLDLCCGTGHVSGALCRRGLRVTGIDVAVDMLRFAKQNAPQGDFAVADARAFHFPACFDAVISTGDSLNHILTADDLARVFRNVAGALAPGGAFVFDLNMSRAFESEWHKTSTVAAEDHLMYIRGRYDRPRKLGSTEVTLFHRHDVWERLDLKFFERCYSIPEVKALLGQAGLVGAAAHPAAPFGIKGRLAVGRTFFIARKGEARQPAREDRPPSSRVPSAPAGPGRRSRNGLRRS